MTAEATGWAPQRSPSLRVVSDVCCLFISRPLNASYETVPKSARAKHILQIYPHIGGDKFIRTGPGDAYHRPVSEEAEYAVLSPQGSTESDVIRSSGVFYADDVGDADWEGAVVELVVETESARPLMVEFDASVDEDGWLELERRRLPWKRRAVSWLYRGLDRVRKIG